MPCYKIEFKFAWGPAISCFEAVLWLAVLPKPGIAQEVEGLGQSGTALFSPADYLELTVPINNRVAVNTYGFYLGNIRSSITLLEVPVTVQKHIGITPSYLFITVPPSGLSLLTGTAAFQSYNENQFRLAASLSISAHGVVVSDRNMYARRFKPTGDVNRYRNKIYVAHPTFLGHYKFTPFLFDEAYHDFLPGPWLRRNWVAAAIDMPINRHLTFQPSYIRQDDQYLRSVNFLGMAIIIKTDPFFANRSDKSQAH